MFEEVLLVFTTVLLSEDTVTFVTLDAGGGTGATNNGAFITGKGTTDAFLITFRYAGKYMTFPYRVKSLLNSSVRVTMLSPVSRPIAVFIFNDSVVPSLKV